MIVVGVRFKRAGKVYYFDPNDVPVELGQPVVVETARGLELGEVTVLPHDVKLPLCHSLPPSEIRPVAPMCLLF
jgi:cell fate regulator YaaT (PSP1 superfamily)